MDYFLKRERRRLVRDIIELQREDDLRRQCQSIIYNLSELDRRRFDRTDSEDDGYRDRHRRNKSRSCLITLTYRGSNDEQRVDEIMVIQHNQTVFKGCLRQGDQLTFKSKHYRDDSRLKLQFYINDLLEDEMVACCEHGFLNKDRNHLFKIEQIFGSKPCYDCELENDTTISSQSTSPPQIKPSAFTKIRAASPTASISRSSSTSSEDQFNERQPKQTQSTLFVPKASIKEASSEGFSADITELSDYHPAKQNPSKTKQEIEGDPFDSLPTKRESPIKRTYGPPQLSTMQSLSEAPDSPSPTIREQSTGTSINASSNIQQQQIFNSYFDDHRNETNSSYAPTQFLRSSSSNTEDNQGSQITSINITTTSNEIAIANDATRLLLAQLGIVRQQQIEHPETLTGDAPREKGNVEYFTLVYLHSSSPDDSIKKRLRGLVNFLKIFNDPDDCVAFINTVFNEKIILIVSNALIDSILSRIEDLQQMFTIYIVCETEKELISSTKQSKIQGSYTNINDVYEQISNDINKITRDLNVYVNLYLNAESIEPAFLSYQLLREIAFDENEIENALQELINFARQEYDENEEELQIINEFENTYRKDQAIYWFSRHCFISKMLNKALRIPEADIVFKLRVFVQDLYKQIKNESVTDSITVYLGQTMQRSSLDDLHKNLSIDSIVAFPQFLFGSTDLSRASRIAKELPRLTEDYIPVLLRFDIPSNMKCANKNSRRYSSDDDNDVLLNMDIISRITSIEKDDGSEDGVATIHLTAIQFDNERKVQEMLEVKRSEIKSFSPFVTLIKLMSMMNQRPNAEHFVQITCNDDTLTNNENMQSSLAASAHILAMSRRDEGYYRRACELFHLSLKTFIRFIPANSIELSPVYSNIASMHFRLDEYEDAREYHLKALDVQLHSNNPDLYSISNYTNNLGIVYLKQGKYVDAIKSFERSLKILEQINQPHDSEVALTYDNLGDAYLAQLKYADALKYYSKSLDIQQFIEPRNLQMLASSHYTIGNLYLKLGRTSDALNHLKRALEYQQEYLPLTHSSFAFLYNNIGLMYYREEQHSEALIYYSKALEIAAISLPENHTMVATTFANIALACASLERFEEAMESIEKSTQQLLKTLPPDHPEVLGNQAYVEAIKRKKMLKELFDENTTSF